MRRLQCFFFFVCFLIDFKSESKLRPWQGESPTDQRSICLFHPSLLFPEVYQLTCCASVSGSRSRPECAPRLYVCAWTECLLHRRLLVSLDACGSRVPGAATVAAQQLPLVCDGGHVPAAALMAAQQPPHRRTHTRERLPAWVVALASRSAPATVPSL